MLLTDFQWSRNPRGMHNTNVFDPTDVSLYTRTGMGWAKLVVFGKDQLNYVGQFNDLGITPLVRVYLGRIGSRPMNAEQRAMYIDYARAGAKWFEFYNEPNLPVEWPGNLAPSWQDTGQIGRLVDHWLEWAEFIIEDLDGYPGFISLAESAAPDSSAVRWMDAMLNYAADRHYDRFLNVLRGGAYCATHPYILNHFYQQIPGGGPASARPAGNQRAREGRWHFEYPYDPISQSVDPGRTLYGGTDLTPYGDPNGLTAMGRMFNERCAQLFGTQAVPVVGTEGGIWEFPAPGEGAMAQDTRFPAYTNSSHAEATLAMFDWITEFAQPWFFGVCLWKEDVYVEKGQATLNRLAGAPPLMKYVPPIGVMQDGSTYIPPGELPPGGFPLRGPGPIHGQADFHMVLIDDTLSSDWFFETGRIYWEQFRPIVTTETDFFEMMPWEKSLAITLIISSVRRFEAEGLIRERYPNAYLDVIVVREDDTSFEQVSRVFAVRVETGRRFG